VRVKLTSAHTKREVKGKGTKEGDCKARTKSGNATPGRKHPDKSLLKLKKRSV